MKNRTLFLLLLAMLPLVILTGVSLWDFFAVPPRPAPDDRKQLDEVFDGKLERDNGLEVAKALAVGLGDVQLLLPLDGKSEFLNHMTQYGKYRESLNYVQNWNSVLCSFLALLEPLRDITPENLSDAEEMNAENEEISNEAAESLRNARKQLDVRFKDFDSVLKNKFSEANFPGAPLTKSSSEIRDDLKEMVELAWKRVDRSVEVHKIKAKFMDAQKFFDAGELEKCDKLCGEIVNNELADDAFKKKVRKLYYKARATLSLAKLDEIEKSESSPQRRLDRLEELSDDVRKVGVGLDEKTRDSIGKEFQTKMEDLVVVSVEELYSDEIIESISALEKNPPQSFADGLDEVGRIAENIQKMNSQLKESMWTSQTPPSVTAFRERLQVILKTLLEEKLPADVSADENIQEALLVGRKTVTGYFDPVTENGETVGYKIYDSYKDFKNPKGSKGVTPKKDFLKDPGPTKESECVKEYLQARTELLASFENKLPWEHFLEACERIQKELKDWENSTGLKASFSLKEQISIARRTLKEENWKKLKKVFK